MLRPFGPFGTLGPLTTEPGIRRGPDLVPVVNCGVNAQGQRFVTISVRNDGTEPTPRLFWVQFSISGRGFISGQAPVSALRPGQQVVIESSADDVLQGIGRLVIFVDVDARNLIPEDLNRSNNRTVARCGPMLVVQPGMGAL